MEQNISINFKLPLVQVNLIVAALHELPFKVAAPIITNLSNQTQDQLARNAAMSELFEGDQEPETTIEERREKAKAKVAK